MGRDRGGLFRIVGYSLLALLVIGLLFGAGGHDKLRSSLAGNAHLDGLESLLGPGIKRQDGFTIMVPTFKRPWLLESFLDGYATGEIPSLRRIVILWHDSETEPPSALINLLASYQVPVTLELRDVSLNQRFKRSKNIQTECVLSIDDDMRFAPADVEMGYQVWKELGQGRKRMVGYIPRGVANRGYALDNLHTYSMVLTKSAFFHIDWMDFYWSSAPQMTGLRAFVDEHRNCEDILLSLLHARHTRLAPIHVEAAYTDEGLIDGISSKPGHVEERSVCVRHFLDILGDDTPVESSFSVKSMYLDHA